MLHATVKQTLIQSTKYVKFEAFYSAKRFEIRNLVNYWIEFNFGKKLSF